MQYRSTVLQRMKLECRSNKLFKHYRVRPINCHAAGVREPWCYANLKVNVPRCGIRLDIKATRSRNCISGTAVGSAFGVITIDLSSNTSCRYRDYRSTNSRSNCTRTIAVEPLAMGLSNLPCPKSAPEGNQYVVCTLRTHHHCWFQL